MAVNELLSILPFLIVTIGGIALLLIDLGLKATQKSTVAWLSVAVLALAGLSALFQMGRSPAEALYGMVRADGYVFFLDALLATIGALSVLLAMRYNEAREIWRGEFYVLLLFSVSGMMLMGRALNLLVLFVAVELLSIPLYVLCGIARPRLESEESAMKYFLIGAFASGFLIYGIALVYGAAGTTSLSVLLDKLNAVGERTYDSALLFAGAALILAGLGFKVAAAPFHMWTPDVYEGAPTAVTAFMATATKVAGFAGILRVFMFGFEPLLATWQPVVAGLAVLTMIVGNVAALVQNNVKRMLAYSSIAHAGYVLIGVAAGNDAGAGSVLFYLAVYAFITLAAFAVLIAVGSSREEDQTFDAYAGLGRRRPVLGIVMAIAMFSLIGIPPSAGFMGKYLLFSAAIAAGLTWLAVLGVLTSVISAYFYLRLVMTMFMREPSAMDMAIPAHAPRALATAISVAAVFVFGLLPAPLLDVINAGIQSAVAR
jgi:NADH-quinone oxidoreductase subunit N